MNAAILVNNADGIVSMMKGHYMIAVQCFRRALATVQASIESRVGSDHLTHYYYALRPLPLLLLEDQNRVAFYECTECFAIDEDHPGEGDRAGTVTVSSTTGVEIVTAALLYNMALAFRLQAMSCGRAIAFFTDKAIAAYKMAARILQHLPETASFTTTTSVSTATTVATDNNNSMNGSRVYHYYYCINNGRTLCLAVANNLAALSLESLDYDSFDDLRRYMTTLIRDEHHDDDDDDDDDDDGRCRLLFAANLAVSEQVRARPAAAA